MRPTNIGTTWLGSSPLSASRPVRFTAWRRVRRGLRKKSASRLSASRLTSRRGRGGANRSSSTRSNRLGAKEAFQRPPWREERSDERERRFTRSRWSPPAPAQARSSRWLGGGPRRDGARGPVAGDVPRKERADRRRGSGGEVRTALHRAAARKRPAADHEVLRQRRRKPQSLVARRPANRVHAALGF